MSKYLFFDTETTGKADFRSEPDSDFQPRIVQLGALLCDENEQEIASLNLVVCPIVDIPEEASAIHGITNEIARSRGVPIFHALMIFAALKRQANLMVAHNIDYDDFVVKGESFRHGSELVDVAGFCTMKSMTPVCKIPGKYGDFKWPKLAEAYQHAFGKELVGAHDAMTDLRATKDLFFWLKKQEVKP